MKCYGQVKGRKYLANQPLPEEKIQCQVCRKYKDPKTFVRDEETGTKWLSCEDCRRKMREYKMRKKGCNE